MSSLAVKLGYTGWSLIERRLLVLELYHWEGSCVEVAEPVIRQMADEYGGAHPTKTPQSRETRDAFNAREPNFEADRLGAGFAGNNGVLMMFERRTTRLLSLQKLRVALTL
jgi:hypothetical protein